MSEQIPFESKNDPSYKKYNLTTKIKFIRKSVREDIGGGKIQSYERKMVILIPQEGDETNRFYYAWVPSTQEEKYELAGVIGSPVNSPCRFSVHMGHDEKSEKPYLFVMSKGVEDIIVKMREGDLVRVTTLPANEDSEADYAQDAQGNFEAINQG